MAKWASAAFLDGSLDYLKANATHQLLVKAYAAADSYATVTGNACADQAMVSADFTKSSSGSNRVVTWAAKTAVPLTANSGASPNNHLAFTDGAAVIYVTDETTDQQLYSGNTVDLPSLSYTSAQPT